MTTVDEKIEQQSKLCEEKREALREDLKGCKKGIDEILEILKGKGADTGIAGLVREHEKRLNSHSLSIKGLWGVFTSMAIAAFAYIFKK